MGRRATTRVLAVAVMIGMAAVTSVVGATPAGAQTNEEFCDANAGLSVLFGRIDDEPTKKQQKAINRLLKKAETSAPAEIAAQATTAVEGVRTGDFENPEVSAAITALDEYSVASCDFQVVEVTGRDYAFDGIPETLERGMTIFALTNTGAELHEIIVVRFKGDETVEELLELSEKQAQKKVEFIGGDFVAQGDTTYAYVDLKKPGRYAALCFLPVGAVDQTAIETADGPPHAVEGMTAEFTVE